MRVFQGLTGAAAACTRGRRKAGNSLEFPRDFRTLFGGILSSRRCPVTVSRRRSRSSRWVLALSAASFLALARPASGQG